MSLFYRVTFDEPGGPVNYIVRIDHEVGGAIWFDEALGEWVRDDSLYEDVMYHGKGAQIEFEEVREYVSGFIN